MPKTRIVAALSAQGKAGTKEDGANTMSDERQKKMIMEALRWLAQHDFAVASGTAIKMADFALAQLAAKETEGGDGD
jgi:hypothetical protein